MEYRDYDTISNNPSDSLFENENYDEAFEQDHHNFHSSNYISYNKTTEYQSVDDNNININFCPKEDLLKLPGVNEQTANRAISLREMLGGFNSVQEFIDMVHIESQYSNQIREMATVKDQNIDLRK